MDIKYDELFSQIYNVLQNICHVEKKSHFEIAPSGHTTAYKTLIIYLKMISIFFFHSLYNLKKKYAKSFIDIPLGVLTL